MTDTDKGKGTAIGGSFFSEVVYSFWDIAFDTILSEKNCTEEIKMFFYKVQGVMTAPAEEEQSKRERREMARTVCIETDMFNLQNDKNSFYFIADSSDCVVSAGVITDKPAKVKNSIEKFLKSVRLPLKDITVTEVTFNTLTSLLSNSYGADYIDDDDTVLERFNLHKLRGRSSIAYGENIVDCLAKEELIAAAQRYLMNEALLPELERIYAGKTKTKASGHPVHYMIQTDDRDTRREVYKLLLSALYANNRLESKRYAFLDVTPGEYFSTMGYDALYNACTGGAVVVRYLANDNTEQDDVSFGEGEIIEHLCEAAKRYRNDVLTVFCLPRECNKVKDRFYENLGTVSLVEIKEDLVKSDRAIDYLTSMAKAHRIRSDKHLFAKLEDEKAYLATELKGYFDEWYNRKLRSAVYPQYKNIAIASRAAIKSKPRGSAYDTLSEMIGLAEAKKVINKAVSYYKMQKLYRERGFKEDHPAMHMMFSGNPGTAKTSVARLFARIMKENGLLSKGQLVELGRGDLIAKYVGWTAQNIQSKFKAAAGGVLFIDEAYSLVDDREGSFGDEAINTIVQEMENHREDVVVILAGYPDKMEKLLQKNPGLRSRIAFHVPFADYSTHELCEIAKLMGRDKGMRLSEEAMQKLAVLFDTAKAQTDFGNGRYVRNLFEQAKMNQAVRLAGLDFDKITDAELSTITAEDIVAPPLLKADEKQKIGFC